jgi:hypothetical protein
MRFKHKIIIEPMICQAIKKHEHQTTEITGITAAIVSKSLKTAKNRKT